MNCGHGDVECVDPRLCGKAPTGNGALGQLDGGFRDCDERGVIERHHASGGGLGIPNRGFVQDES
jgi:hypothetical protein